MARSTKCTITSLRAGAIVMFCVACSSCQDPRTISKLQEEIAILRGQLGSQDASQKEVIARVGDIESDLKVKRIIESFERRAFLTPGSDGFSTIQTDMGPITASLANVVAYASGTRATLQFGNLSSGDYSNVGLKVDWGTLNADRTPNSETARSKEVALIETFKSGSFTRVDIVLDGVPPAELGYVRIHSLEPKQVSLHKAN